MSTVNVTVEGKITDDDLSYWEYFSNCDEYSPQNSSCVYGTSMIFEVLPPAADQDSTVKTFLNEFYIRMVLQILDPSFQQLVRIFQSSDVYDPEPDNKLTFCTHGG
jgi:hypothetical protein